MAQTLIQGLKEKDMQAVINTYAYSGYYFPTLFPEKMNLSLDWKSLMATANMRVAADVVSRDSTIPRKTRESVDRIGGTIPKIAISREKFENELNEYETLKALTQGNANQAALVEFWADDMAYCWEGVAARIEWLALRSISTGKVTLSQSNNDAVITEFDVDYQLPTDQLLGVDSSWSTVGAKPISVDLKAAIAAARAKGIRPRYLFLNTTTLAAFAQNEEVIKMSASFAQNALGISQMPDLTTINAMLRRLPYLYGLQIVEIDQEIGVEIDGVRTKSNPFEDNVVMLSETNVLGQTYWTTPVDMKLNPNSALKVMNGLTCIKKFSKEEPLQEVTQGIANAFPAWTASDRSILIKTDNSSWNL